MLSPTRSGPTQTVVKVGSLGTFEYVARKGTTMPFAALVLTAKSTTSNVPAPRFTALPHVTFVRGPSPSNTIFGWAVPGPTCTARAADDNAIKLKTASEPTLAGLPGVLRERFSVQLISVFLLDFN